MSAVPQIPEGLVHDRDEIAETVSNGINDKESSVKNVEHASPNGVDLTNGVKATHGVDDGVKKDAFRVHDTVVENFRPIRVIVIGAGYSGIYHGIRIPERIKNCELVIYEKNAGVGGTW